MNRLYVKIALIVIVIIIIMIISKKVANKIKQRKAEKLFQKSSINGTVNGQPYSLNPATVAQEINDAFHDNDWFGMSEDEEKAIVAINNVPKQFVPLVADAYLKMFSKNLSGEMVKYLGDDYKKVRAQFN